MIDVKKLEKQNNVRINVFRLNDSSKIFPYYISEYGLTIQNFDDRTIDVLELCSFRGNHYTWIKNLSKALRLQISPSTHVQYLICRRCLFTCYSSSKYADHVALCQEHKIQAISLPRLNCPKKMDKFSYSKKCNVTEKECEFPYYFYADIECLLVPEGNDLHESNKSGETVINKHVPSAMAYVCAR